MSAALHDEAVAVLQRLLRFDTVNPPGREREAQEYLAGLLAAAEFEVTLAGSDPERPNLVARLSGRTPGPVLCLLSHVDTVGADPAGWTHGPWSGDLADGCVWGRGALDMKSQTAAEVVAACAAAGTGWRPAAGDLLVVCVIDEEVGGTGAQWLCAERPELVRCDYLLNEGDGAATVVDGRRFHGVSVAEKGVFRFTLATDGTPGHASMPSIADNALLKLAPLLRRMAERQAPWDVTDGPRAMLATLGLDVDGDPGGALEALRARAPELAPIVEPMLRVTLSPTMADASTELNVIPHVARLHVDCRVPPGMEEPAVLERIRSVLGEDGYRLDFTETVVGNDSPADSPLMDALEGWLAGVDPDAALLPTIMPGYSDSRTFRDAFPECVAYGFFPHRHMTEAEVARLVHGHDERIDVRDLALAVDCYGAVARTVLGG